jgi:hypothetical protein
MEIMIKKTFKQSLILISLLAIASVFFMEWKFPLSVIIGGIIFLASLWVLSWAVRKFLGKPMGQVIIVGISALKILVIFIILIALAMLGIINVVGLMTGFVVSLIVTLKEGFIAARQEA